MKFCKKHNVWYYEEHTCRVCWENRAHKIEAVARKALEKMKDDQYQGPTLDPRLDKVIEELEGALDG